MFGIFLMKGTSFVFRRCPALIGLLLLVCPATLSAQNMGMEREEYMSWDDFVEEYVYRVSEEDNEVENPQFPQWLEERYATALSFKKSSASEKPFIL